MESWLFQFESFLRTEVLAFCVDVLVSWLSSIELLWFSRLYLFDLLAAFASLQPLSAVWLVFWQCGQGGSIFSFSLLVVCFLPRRSCSLRMLFRHSLMTYRSILHYLQTTFCCSAFCGWICLFNAVVPVAIVGLDNSESLSTHSIQVLFLSEQLFVRRCHSLNNVSFLSVCWCGDAFPCNKLSIIWCAGGQEARLALSYRSSMKFENDFVLVSKVR